MFCREWFIHSIAAGTLTASDCPVVCDKQKPKIDINRTDYCKTCSHRLKETAFQRRVERSWEEWLGKKADKFKFGKMKSHLMIVRQAMNIPRGQRSLAVNHFIQIYEGERQRFNDLRTAQK